jgi:hypothetical protein
MTKKYEVIGFGRVMAEVQYPANTENCWWFNIQVWSEKNGFIKSAQHLTEDGELFELVEA